MSSPQRPGLPSPTRPSSHEPSRQPSRWVRTLPWLAGLLLGTSAHIVWWTSTRAPAEPVVRVVTAPSPEVHVHVHQTPPKATMVTHVKTGSCQPDDRHDERVRRREQIRHEARAQARRSALSGTRGAMVCSDGGCTIRRSFLTSLLREPGLLGQGTRVRPARSEDGTTDGLQLRGVFPGSVPDLLGLRSGDTVLAIDGRATRSPSDLVQRIRALDHVGGFTITVRRHDVVHTLSHRVVDG